MSTCRRMWTDRQIRSMAVDSVEEKENLEVFEHIVDKDGHKRFIEGDITIETISGVTQTYGKWSLSGTHLMIVLGISIDNGTAIASSSILASIPELPEWIVDKIIPLFDVIVVERKAHKFFASDYTTQDLTINFTKEANVMTLRTSSFTATANRFGRIQIDLLIDNE